MSPEQLLREAQSLHQSGRLPEAERHYLRLVELFPANADLWHLLGVVAYQQGDAPKAILRYRKALALRDDFPQARNNLALALKGAGDLEAAAETFATVLAARPALLDLPRLGVLLASRCRSAPLRTTPALMHVSLMR